MLTMKVFTKEVKVGLTVIAAVVMLVYGINFLKGINLFQKSKLYYIAFHDISGLVESNPVYANGYRIGIVRTINYDYNRPGNIYVGIEVDDDMVITEGSRAELETQMLGGVTMNILLAQNPHALSPGDTIYGGPKTSALDNMAEMMPQMQQMLPKIDSILTSVNTLLADPALRQTLSNTAVISENLASATKTIDALMAGKMNNIAANLVPVSRNLNELTGKLSAMDYAATMGNVNATLDSLQKTTASLSHAVNTTVDKLNNPNSSLGLLLNDPSLYNNLNNTVVSSDSLLRDLRLNPKRYVHFSIFGRKK